MIDNVISNVITEDTISGNIINTIPDHLGQFLILPYHSIVSNSKQEILHRNFKIFSKNFVFQTSKKEQEKPWLTKGILQSIKQKNIYHKFIRSKETTSKEAFLQKLKYYKNLINKLTRINKINFLQVIL